MENFIHTNDIYHVFPTYTGLQPIVLNVWIHRRGKTVYEAIFIHEGKIVTKTTQKSKVAVNRFGQQFIEREMNNGIQS